MTGITFGTVDKSVALFTARKRQNAYNPPGLLN